MFRIEGMTRNSRYGTLVLNVRLINLTDDRNVILRRPLSQVRRNDRRPGQQISIAFVPFR